MHRKLSTRFYGALCSCIASNVMNFWWCKFHHCLWHGAWKFIAVSMRICTTRFRIWRRCSLPGGGNAFIDFSFSPITLHCTQLMTAISLTQLMMVYGATVDLLQFSGFGSRRDGGSAGKSCWDKERWWLILNFKLVEFGCNSKLKIWFCISVIVDHKYFTIQKHS